MHEISVCLIEDSDADATLIELLARESKLTNEFLRFADGESALDYLLDESHAAPDLVLLDLNMPGISGADVLATIRSTPCLSGVRVILLTAADSEASGADLLSDGSVIKPVGMHGFLQIVQSLDEFWLTVVSTRPA